MIRRLPTARLLALTAAVLAVLIGGTAIAVGALTSKADTPPAKPLNAAIRDAANAPAVDGVTARIEFTNRLIDASSIHGANPLLTGATGRLWAAADGRLRLELQSEDGDAQITSDGKVATIVDSSSKQAYRVRLPEQDERAERRHEREHKPVTLARVDRMLRKLGRDAEISDAIPSVVGNRGAYTVRVRPKHDGGLVGAGELGWDAVTGTPLRAAVYAAGKDAPVLELAVTDISYGKIAAADLTAPVPSGLKVTKIDLRKEQREARRKHAAEHRSDRGGDRRRERVPNDAGAVAAKLPFTLSAPGEVAGLPRKSVRLIRDGEHRGALVTYGEGLGGIAVLQAPAKAGEGIPSERRGHEDGLELPKVTIGQSEGRELATELGTLVQFERDGVRYTVVGSVPPLAAEAAARAL